MSLKFWMKKKNMTQKNLANALGVAQSALSLYVNEKAPLPEKHHLGAAIALDVTLKKVVLFAKKVKRS